MRLKGYAREILGFVMHKPMYAAMSNWTARNLSKVQVHYACIDGFVDNMLGSKVLWKIKRDG